MLCDTFFLANSIPLSFLHFGLQFWQTKNTQCISIEWKVSLKCVIECDCSHYYNFHLFVYSFFRSLFTRSGLFSLRILSNSIMVHFSFILRLWLLFVACRFPCHFFWSSVFFPSFFCFAKWIYVNVTAIDDCFDAKFEVRLGTFSSFAHFNWQTTVFFPEFFVPFFPILCWRPATRTRISNDVTMHTTNSTQEKENEVTQKGLSKRILQAKLVLATQHRQFYFQFWNFQLNVKS